MFENKECFNDTEQGCSQQPGTGGADVKPNDWLEETVWHGMRMWHCIFLGIGAALGFVILICCCFKFRIPRTKQEIEGDYIRRKIMHKFRKRLKAIQNQELDEMDLKKALDKIRTELKSDTESLQQSDVLSGATFSSAGGVNPAAGSTYRRASQIQIDISLEDLRIQSMGLGARIALALTKLFGRQKKAQSGESDEENGGNGMGDVGSDKPTTALIPPKKQGATATTAITKGGDGEDANKKKKDKDEQKGKDASGPESKVDGAATTSKEKATGKGGDEKNKKDAKKKETAAAAATPATTTVVTTEKETGSSDKKQDKKNNKGKKEKEENNKPKTGAASASKEATDKDPKIKNTDKKNNESQPKK